MIGHPDICVIGTGPGGAFAAAHLAKAGLSVLVLEAGSEIPDSDQTKTIDRLSVLGGARPNFGFSCQIGGASNLWAGRVAPLESIDFEPRTWIKDSGWPISRADLWPYYKSALHIMGLPDEIASADGSLPEGWHSILEGLELKQFYWSSPPFNTGAYLSSAIEKHPTRLRLLTRTRVTSLGVAANGKTILAANARVNGVAERIEADYFVLAAGGIETPRLLLNSTGHFQTGIGNTHGVVGRYLSTHPKADLGLLLLRRNTGLAYSAFADQTKGNIRIRSGIGMTADAQARLGTLNHYVQLSPLFEYQANRAFELMKGGVAAGSPLLNRSRAIQGFLPGLGAMAYELVGRLGGLQRRAKKFVLRGFLDQIPSPHNRVYLSDSPDQYGSRKANIEWTFSDADKRSVLQFMGEMDQVFSASGLGNVDFSVLRETDDWPITGIHSHFMGTTRMGTDPEISVVDDNCLIHGLENCYISGPSTFPTYGYANPFLTIAALSLRLADHICDRVGIPSRVTTYT